MHFHKAKLMKKGITPIVLTILCLPCFCQNTITTNYYTHYWQPQQSFYEKLYERTESSLPKFYMKEKAQLLHMQWGYKEVGPDQWVLLGAAFNKDSMNVGHSYQIWLMDPVNPYIDSIRRYCGQVIRPLHHRYNMYNMLEEEVKGYPGGNPGDIISVEVIWESNFITLKYMEPGIYHVYCFWAPGQIHQLSLDKKGLYEYEQNSIEL